MTRFAYSGRDGEGAPCAGELESPDRRAALRRLAERGVAVAALDEAKPAPKPAQPDAGAPQAPRRAFHAGPHPVARAFLENYRELLAAGMPAGDAVRLLAQNVAEPQLRALCASLWQDLAEGRSLAAALARRPDMFEDAVTRLVEAGEHAGKLEPVIAGILEDFGRRDALRRRLVTALAYPCCVAATAMAVLALFVFWILPRMEDMMRAIGGEFPASVRALLFLAEAGVKGLPVALPVLALLIHRWRRRRAIPAGRLEQDAFALRIPALGAALRHAEAARVAGLLATLLAGGVGATDGLRLAGNPIANAALAKNFAEARRRVNDGAGFAGALRDAGLFEPADLDLVTVGENAGALPRAFAAVAERHRRALDAGIARLVPAVTTVFLGGAVGLVFLCLLAIVTTILAVSKGVLPAH